MRKSIVLQKFSDPGHGWIKVSLFKLLQFVHVEDISPFSYMRNGHAYLEEDSDAYKFIMALHNAGITPEIVHRRQSNKQSKIRGYQRFNADAVRREIAVSHGIA